MKKRVYVMAVMIAVLMSFSNLTVGTDRNESRRFQIAGTGV